MRIVAIDFETFFTDAKDERGRPYTLTHLSTEDYVRHPWFEAHGAAIKWSEKQPAQWYDERELQILLQQEDWSDVFLIAHHMQFDGFILGHHYNVFPALYGCTMSMARMVLGNHIGVSLDSVRSQFGLPVKRTPYHLFRGKHWEEMSRAVQEQVADGACDEVESIWKLFKILGKTFPREEYQIIDATIRMFTQPVLRADTDLLGRLWQAEAQKKKELLEALSLSESQLQSADQFQSLLEAEGIEIEYKQGKNNLIPAFARTDDFMRDLREHPNERVRALAEARLGVKSTLLQTRAESLAWAASRGPLPVYLRYCGAHTKRWSGGDDVNWQNFKRESDLRNAIMAPEGYLLGIIDLSQIECRLLNYLAGQWDVIAKFRNNEDPYIGIASLFYGRAITKNDKNERGTGKQAELSCGYGCGAPKFRATAKLGIYGPPVNLSEDDALRFVRLYRDTHKCVVDYWSDGSRMMNYLEKKKSTDWGPMQVKDGKIYLPNGCPLDYTTLEFYTDSGNRYWRVRKRQGWTKLYGAKLVENVVQALARVVLSQAMLRIMDYFRIVTTSHDEIVVLIPNNKFAEGSLELCRQQMIVTPSWLPGIPLDAEAHLSVTYSK